MFTGTVVENFSYVFQMGGQPKLSREQMRNFKQAWAEHDKTRTGCLPQRQLVGFFNRLGGSMELKVHPGDASIKSLKSKMMSSGPPSNRTHSSISPIKSKFAILKSPLGKDIERGHFAWPPPSPLGSPTEVLVEGMNISRLNKQLSLLDYADIRRRKQRFEQIYYEATILSEIPSNINKGGIPFHEMLMLVAHYKLINDDEALCLEELVERRALQEKVEDRIQTEKVRGMLRLIWLRRRFLALQAEKLRMSANWTENDQYHTNLPVINIDDSAAAASSTSFSGRPKPKLTLNLGNVNSSSKVEIASQPLTPPRPNFSFEQQQSTQHLSPHRTIRTLVSNEDEDRPSILVTTSDDGSHEGSLSPTLQEVERRASNAMDTIDASAWGALAKRLSSDTSRNVEDDKGNYGRVHFNNGSPSNQVESKNEWL